MANLAVYCLVLFFTVHGFLQCSGIVLLTSIYFVDTVSPNKLGSVETFIVVTAHNIQRIVDVRLTGGSNSSSGTLQLRSITPRTDWQDFCGYYNSRVFAVVCRMLGFENIVHYPSKSNIPVYYYLSCIIIIKSYRDNDKQ